MTTWLRGARCTDPEAMPENGSAAPGRKPPRWSAERRASRVMGRAAPHQRGGRASHARQQNKCACRRSAHPSIGVDAKGKREPRRTNAPRERRTLRCLTLLVETTANGSRASRDAAHVVWIAHPTLVSRPSERQRAKRRDPGATRRVAIKPCRASRLIALGPGSRSTRARARSLHSAGTREQWLLPIPAMRARRSITSHIRPCRARHMT